MLGRAPLSLYLAIVLHASLAGGSSALPPDVAAGRLGFPVDRHTVHTRDGYFLEVFRYLGGQHEEPRPNPAAGKPTALLMPGLGCNADVWFPEYEDSLPNVLANAGFEVWLGNYRGSTFGRRHEQYSFFSREFWSFGWNENALYDIGDTLKFMRKTSHQNKTQFIGHSLGSTLFVALNALTDEFHDHISHGYLLAPAVFLGYTTTGLATARPLSPIASIVVDTLLHDQFAVQEAKIPETTEALCRLLPTLCEFFYNFTMGKCDLVKKKMPEMFERFPNDFSLKQLIQYGQLYGKVRTFNQFDYGRTQNMKKYGSEVAPTYNISNVLNPVSLYVGTTDAVADFKDAQDLCEQLPNIKRLYLTPYETFSHGDFLLGKNALRLYQTLLQHMREDASSYPSSLSSEDRSYVCSAREMP